MLFYAPLFLFGILPATLAAFHLALRVRPALCVPVLLVASLAFYVSQDARHLPLLVAMIFANHLLVGRIRARPAEARGWIALGVAANLLPLIWFKYLAPPSEVTVAGLAVVAGMPLGLSFYAFQQVTALFDGRDRDMPRLSLAEHALFAGIFAQVPSGPISRYRDLAPQIARLGSGRVRVEAVLAGLSLFVFGVFKQRVLAGYLADGVVDPIAQRIGAAGVSGIDGWALGWGFLVQLYLDFSGYSDMALGLAGCFGLTLPVNFASPLRARSASQFVDRWHMSLVAWVREYLYKPVFQAVSRLPIARRERRRVLAWATATIASMTVLGAWHGGQPALILTGAVSGVVLVLLQVLPQVLPVLRRSPPLASPMRSRLRRAGARVLLLATLSVLGLALRIDGTDALAAVLRPMFGGGLVGEATAPASVLSARALAKLAFASAVVLFAPSTMQMFGRVPAEPGDTAVAARLRWRPTAAWGVATGLLAVVAVMSVDRAGNGFIYAHL